MGKLAGLDATGYKADTPEHYLVDSATIYKDVSFATGTNKFSGTLLGATNGGVEIDITQKYRDIEVDGTYWSPVKGNKALSSTEVSAKTSIKEFTADILAMSINGETIAATTQEAPAGYTVVTGKRFVDATDYVSNIAIVGKLSGTNDPVIFILDNVLATAGAKIKTKDDDEAVIPVEFTAHASYEQVVNNEFPYRIYFPSIGDVLTGIAVTPAITAGVVGVDKSIVLVSTPAGASIPEVIYSTSDPLVATVDRNGVVKFLKAGKVTITIVTKDGRLSTTTGEITVTAS